MKKLLQTEHIESLEQRIRQLEAKTCGELVVYIAKQSDDYRMSAWKSATFSLALTAIYLIIPDLIWAAHGLPGIIKLCVLFAAGVAGFGLGYFSKHLRIWLTPEVIERHRVQTRAHDIFLQRALFNTKNKTGILFYISILEGNITVLSDSGIAAKVEDEQWNAIVQLVVTGMKEKKLYESLTAAIEKCESLLIEHHFLPESEQQNELGNEIIIE